METKKIVQELKKKYPSKKIILNDKKNPSEIICETEPSSKHPQYSAAIAVIDKTEAHYHKKAAEIYYVLKGSLNLYIDQKKYVLGPEEFRVIPPKTTHWAQGKKTWVLVYSEPGWTKEDHYLTQKPALQMEQTHTRLLVTNFKDCFHFYHKILGFTVLWGNEDKNYAELDTGLIRLAIFKKQLMQKALGKQGKLITDQGVNAILNFRVDNLKQTYEALKEKKVKFLNEPQNYSDWGIFAVHFLDPDDNLLELYEDIKK